MDTIHENVTRNMHMHQPHRYGNSFVNILLYIHFILTCFSVQSCLINHVHPAVSLLARQLLTNQPLPSSPDLSLHTLNHFLDRFVYKNPKKLKKKGSSAMQPVSALATVEGLARTKQ